LRTLRCFPTTAAILTVSLLLASGCDQSTPPPRVAHLNEPFSLAAGETVVLEDVLVSVTFDHVISDDRCPVEFICNAAGSATIEISVALSGHATELFTLATNSGQASVAYNGYEIALQRILPDAHANRTIAPGDYRAVLLVTQQP